MLKYNMLGVPGIRALMVRRHTRHHNGGSPC
jgi:hypothetical protein